MDAVIVHVRNTFEVSRSQSFLNVYIIVFILWWSAKSVIFSMIFINLIMYMMFQKNNYIKCVLTIVWPYCNW